MNCTTCNDTRTVMIGHQTANCPDCSPVHHDTGPARPVPVTITLYCASVQATANADGDPPLRAIVNDVDYQDILNQVPVAEAVKYYGAGNLLANMQWEEIKEYLNSL